MTAGDTSGPGTAKYFLLLQEYRQSIFILYHDITQVLFMPCDGSNHCNRDMKCVLYTKKTIKIQKFPSS